MIWTLVRRRRIRTGCLWPRGCSSRHERNRHCAQGSSDDFPSFAAVGQVESGQRGPSRVHAQPCAIRRLVEIEIAGSCGHVARVDERRGTDDSQSSVDVSDPRYVCVGTFEGKSRYRRRVSGSALLLRGTRRRVSVWLCVAADAQESRRG
jgi:hypothetical protein